MSRTTDDACDDTTLLLPNPNVTGCQKYKQTSHIKFTLDKCDLSKHRTDSLHRAVKNRVNMAALFEVLTFVNKWMKYMICGNADIT